MDRKTIVVDFSIDPRIESQTKEFLTKLNSGYAKPMEKMTPKEARDVLTSAQKSVVVDVSGIDVSEKIISQDGITVKLIIVRPSGVGGKLPAFMFFHGGGWVLGDYQTHERLIRDLVVNSGAVGVYVDYTRSPEARYPTAINEAYAATKWVAMHGDEINVDGKQLAVAGNSVGGNMATVVCLLAKRNGGPELKMQVLLWPVTDGSFGTVSYNLYATDRFLTKSMMIWFWDNYAPTSEERNEIYASPLRASTEQLEGLPPALVQTAENDVLRDEGEDYARKMNEAGVNVTLVRYLGLIHDFGLLNPLANIPEVQSALFYAASELKKALFGEAQKKDINKEAA